MNSYNDNLNSVVSASLQAQELANKQLNSQRIASMFSLYHAEGATITAFEKLQADQKTLKEKSDVQTQAVQCSNISTNLLASATQAASYVAQSVTNTSVAAANTQIAGNAILKLAGDMGNVYSIVNAADFDTEIYKQGKEAMELINQTAYLAEVATKIAMDASIRTSEVSSPVVLTKSKATNTLMGNMLQITTTDFNNASQIVTTDNANVSAASVIEKAAEGNYEDIAAEYRASRSVYKASNEQLNLGLTVNTPLLRGESGEVLATTSESVSTRNIQFDLITSPFAVPIVEGAVFPPATRLTPDDNPVSDYYIILVNETEQATFSITDAEGIILKGASNYIRIHVTPSQLKPQGTELVFTPAVLKRTDTNQLIKVSEGRVSMNVDLFDVNGGKLLDSDGKPVDLGVDYVVFLLAVYDNNYKRKLNNFEDYLSVFSNVFALANILTPVTGVEVKELVDGTDPDTADWFPMQSNGQELPAGSKPIPDSFEILFSASENPSYASNVEYRCLILPGDDNVMSGLLTRSTLLDLEDEVSQLEQIADKYDPLIANTHDQLISTRMNFSRMDFKPFTQPTNPPTTTTQQKEFNTKFNALNDKLVGTKDAVEVKTLNGAIQKMLLEFKRISFIPSYQTTTPPTTSAQQAGFNKEYNDLQEELEKARLNGDEQIVVKVTAKIKELNAKFKKQGFTPSFQATTPPTTVKQQAAYNGNYNTLNDNYVNALAAKTQAMAEIQQHTADNFSFFFNLTLAEQVSAGNYILPEKYMVRNNVQGYQWPVIDFCAPFGPGTTDNFGNPLIPGKKYTVVVLSISTAEEQNLSKFINNWTGSNTPVVQFTYTEAEEVPAEPLTPAKENNSKKNNSRKK
jgi:hypothetical protein